MKLIRLVLVGAALASFAVVAHAQSSQPQGSYSGCSRSKPPAATS